MIPTIPTLAYGVSAFLIALLNFVADFLIEVTIHDLSVTNFNEKIPIGT
jgi:hypothetical protein